MKSKLLNKKIIAITIVIILVIAIIGITSLSENKTSNTDCSVSSETGSQTEDDSTIFSDENEENVKEGLTDEELNDIKKTMDTFTEFSIIKTTVLQEKEPERSTTKEIITATINLEDMSVSFEPETDKTFEEIFGFNYKGYDSAYDIMIALMKIQGISTDFENADFAELLYSNMGQWQYILLGNSRIFDKMISEIEYDEIIYTSASYNKAEYTEGHFFIESTTASVKYKISNKTMMSTICFDIVLPERSSCGCGCGSDNEHTCTDEYCSICEGEEANYE